VLCVPVTDHNGHIPNVLQLVQMYLLNVPASLLSSFCRRWLE